MVRALFVCLIALSLAPYALGQEWATAVHDDDTMPGVVYVRFVNGRAPLGGAQSGFSSFDQLTTGLQVRSLSRAFPMADAIAAKQPASESTRWLQGVYRLEYNAAIAPSSVAQWLSSSPDVDMVEPQYIYKTVGEVAPLVSPNDTYYSTSQRYLTYLEIDDAWDTVKGDSGDVVIAIVDEGFELTHPDLSGTLWVNSGETAGNNLDDDNNGYVDDINGWNFESRRANTASVDGDAHGMWVGGVANAETDNSKGMAGAAWNARTMVLNAGCVGSLGTVCHYINALLYAINNGADVINCSWGSRSSSEVLRQTIRSALDNDALVVAAVGNSNVNIDHTFFFPARYPEVLSVGSTDEDNNKKAPSSNFGRTVNVFAQGERILVTDTNNGFTEGFGTSFAAPLVTGIAALVRTERPGLDADQVRELIRLTSHSIESDNNANLAGLLGSGRPDADEALTATIPPAVRLTDYKVTDANGDGVGAPGEEITIKATFTNYGGNASNVSVGFSTAHPYMDWNTSSATVATLNYGQTYTGTYSFDVADDTPADYRTPLYTSITQGTFTDSPDGLSMTLNYVAPYVTHTNSSTSFSLGRLGNVGHPRRRDDRDGSAGFQRNISNRWEDFLFHGGFMLGTSSSDFADCLVNSTYTGYERDFAVKAGSALTLSNPGSIGSQDGHVTLVESSTTGSNLDVEVAVNSYTFDAAADDDYVILHYVISNEGSSTITGLHAGLYVDLSVSGTASGDNSTFDSGRRTGYLQAASGRAETLGVRLLSRTGDLNYEAFHVSPVVSNGFTDYEKWSRLSGGMGTTTVTGKNIAQVIGVGPLRITAGSSVEVAFALVHGGSASDFLANSDAAQRQWHLIAGDGIELSADVTTVSESDGATTVTVTAETANKSRLASEESYTITATGSGTTSAVDFAAVNSFSIAVASGSSSGTGSFTLTPTNDSVDETNETITIGSSSPRVVETTTITLTDDDAAPTGITLVVSEDTVDEGDGATAITLTGTVTGTTTYGAAQTLPISAAGSGTANAVDFTAISDFDLVVAAEGTKGTATFTVTPTDDQTSETDETITLSSTSSLVSNSPTVVITDNDGGGTIDIELSADVSTLSENASATTVTVTAATKNSNNVASDQALTISVAGSGTASAVDFAAVSDFTITISSGSSSGTGTFTLTPTNDSVDETDETITISSSSAFVSQNATITLTDDDDTPTGISLAVSTNSVDEGAGTTTITLTGTVGGTTTYGAAQTLPIRVAGSGATDAVGFTAVADFDLVIQAEGSSGTAAFDLTPEDDQTAEDDETVTISSSSSLVTNAPTITITDNDGGSSVDLALSSDVTTLNEDAGATTITLTAATLSGDALANAATVPIAVTGSGEESAVDFSAASEVTLTIASGESSGTGTFTLTPADDVVDEADETITLVSTGTLTSQAVTITLTDDDDAPTGVTLSVSPDVVSEADGATTITIQGDVTGGTTYGAPQLSRSASCRPRMPMPLTLRQ